MKRILPLLFALALTCACTIENPEVSAPSTGLKKILIEATISDDNADLNTKTALGTGGTVQWTGNSSDGSLDLDF